MRLFKEWFYSPVAEVDVPAALAVLEPVPNAVTVAIPERHAAKPDMSKEEFAEYASVADKIGIGPQTAFLGERIRHFLADNNMHIYNYTKVAAYLDKELGNDWEWRGLRLVDATHLGGWFTDESPTMRRVNFSKEVYQDAIPLPVLLTIEKIQQALPEVYFYVSAPKGNDGDPFLAVTSQHLGMFIVERWNEPSFREY